MQWDKIQFFVSLLSLICLCVSYWYLSKKDKISNLDKGVVASLSIGILFLTDKIKLLLWLMCVCAIWLIKHYKKNKRNEFT